MRSITLCTLSITLLCGCQAGEENPRKITPIMVWTDSDSHQTTALFSRCDSREELSAIWYEKHKANDDVDYTRLCPEVDFDKCMVIALFAGEGSSNVGLLIMESSTKRMPFAFGIVTSPIRPPLSLAQPLPNPRRQRRQVPSELMRSSSCHALPKQLSSRKVSTRMDLFMSHGSGKNAASWLRKAANDTAFPD